MLCAHLTYQVLLAGVIELGAGLIPRRTCTCWAGDRRVRCQRSEAAGAVESTNEGCDSHFRVASQARIGGCLSIHATRTAAGRMACAPMLRERVPLCFGVIVDGGASEAQLAQRLPGEV